LAADKKKRHNKNINKSIEVKWEAPATLLRQRHRIKWK